MTSPVSSTRGRPRKTEEEQAEIRQRIVRTATALFTSEGYGAVSMRRIAKDIGLSPMAIYSYFPSKLAILSQLVAYVKQLAEFSRQMHFATGTLHRRKLVECFAQP